MNCDIQPKPQKEYKTSENINLSPDKAREIRAYGILGKGDLPKMLDKENFLVPSQSDSTKKYKVMHEQSWSCDCPDFTKRKQECKHIKAIKLFLKLRNSQDNDVLELEEKVMKEEIACPKCKSNNIIKRGFLKTETENKQRYSCKECNKRFVVQILNRTKVNAKMVTLIMDLYYKGNSLRDIKDTIKQFFDIQLHHETIRRYILKFTKTINHYTENLNPETSNRFQIDEQKVRTKHNEMLWSWNCIDTKTRFLVANNITKGRSIEETQEVFTKLKEKTKKNKDIELVTDAMPSYPSAIGKEFHKLNDWEHNRKIRHIAKAGLRKTEDNNNIVERYHGQFREFDKIRRGMEEVENFNKGFSIYHNFIREHSGIGTTPALASGIDLSLGRNRWLSLLKQSLK